MILQNGLEREMVSRTVTGLLIESEKSLGDLHLLLAYSNENLYLIRSVSFRRAKSIRMRHFDRHIQKAPLRLPAPTSPHLPRHVLTIDNAAN
jgi:hypothetical protein